jgi:hypothetical protein
MQRLVIDREVTLFYYHGHNSAAGEDGATLNIVDPDLSFDVNETVIFEDGQRHEAVVTAVDAENRRIDVRYTDGTTNVWGQSE